MTFPRYTVLERSVSREFRTERRQSCTVTRQIDSAVVCCSLAPRWHPSVDAPDFLPKGFHTLRTKTAPGHQKLYIREPRRRLRSSSAPAQNGGTLELNGPRAAPREERAARAAHLRQAAARYAPRTQGAPAQATTLSLTPSLTLTLTLALTLTLTLTLTVLQELLLKLRRPVVTVFEP